VAEFVFKMTAFCFSTCAKTGLPLPDCRISYDVLINSQYAFRGQSRSPNMASFDMSGMVSY